MFFGRKNLDNSTVMQIAADGIATARTPEQVETWKRIEEMYGGNDDDKTADRKRLDDKFASHSIPESKITFSQLRQLCDINVYKHLSVTAIALLSLLISTMSQCNLVQASRDAIMEHLGLQSIYNVKGALRELIDTGCIKIALPHKRHDPPVYMVSPNIAIACQAYRRDYLQDIFYNLSDVDTVGRPEPVDTVRLAIPAFATDRFNGAVNVCRLPDVDTKKAATEQSPVTAQTNS